MMKPININFAVKRERQKTFIAVLVTISLLLALSMMGLSATQFSKNKKRIDHYRQKIAYFHSNDQQRRLSSPASVDDASLEKEIVFYNALLRKKAFGWLDILEFLEKGSAEGIVLSHLMIDREKRAIHFEGRSDTPQILSLFIRQMMATDRLQLGEMRQQLQPDGAITFTMGGRISP